MPVADLSPGGDKIFIDTLYREKDQVRKIPGASWNAKQTVWQVPVSWASCIVLRGVFGDQLQVGDGLSEWARNEFASRVGPALSMREALTAVGSDKLYPFQRAGAEFLRIAERALLCDGLGAGKTRQAVMAAMRIYQEGGNPFPMLVVCPNSTKTGWRREVNEVWPGLEVVVVKGGAAKRREQLESPAHVYIINWEALRSHSRLAPYGNIALKRCKECGGEDERISWSQCQVHLRELNQIKFNLVVGDEVHRAKSPTTAQTRALWAATGDARYRIGMTGTPIADTIDDLWPVLHWLAPEEHPSKTKYIDRYAELSFNAFGAPTVIGLKPDTKEEFFKIVDPRMRRMPKDLVLRHLPPVVHERRDVEMNPKQKKAYKQMSDQMIAELDDGNLLTTSSPLTRVTRLLQFASSYAEIEEFQQWNPKTNEHELKTRVRLTDPSNKIDAFMDDLPDFGDDSIVVFSQSRQLIELLSARMTTKNLEHGLVTGAQGEDDRQFHIDNFQGGKTKYILCTTGAGGVGLTLTAGRIGVFLSRPWSSIESVQAEGRVHRIGSEIHQSVSIIDYVSTDTLEEQVHAVLRSKAERLEEVLRDRDLLRRMLVDGEI